MEIKTDNSGFKFYDKLPSSFVVASPADFFKEIIHRDKENNITGRETVPRLNHPFLVQSFHDRTFHPFRIRENFDPLKLAVWFDAQKVYIYSS